MDNAENAENAGTKQNGQSRDDRADAETAPDPPPAFPWGPAAATGVGSMPGEDARETVRIVTGALASLPFLPELPARGPGADIIGRTAGLLPELYARVEPSGWRISDRPGRDTRLAQEAPREPGVARGFLREDLDALEEFTQGYGGALKVSAAGPWTLAAALERRNGEAMLGDAGACRDLVQALAEGLRGHLADVRRRVPGARLVLQLDEPSLPAVLRGRVATASGYRAHAAVDPAVAEEALRALVAVAGGDPVVVHACAPGVPFALLRRAGATAVSFNASLLTERDDEAIGEAVEGGTALFAGVVPATGVTAGELSDPAGTVGGVRTLWRRLGLSPAGLADAVAVTPVCGLAGSSPGYARAALEHCVRAARSLADAPE